MAEKKLVEPRDAPKDRLPAVPLTLEGSCVLHQMFRIRWPAWRRLAAAERTEAVEEAGAFLGEMQQAHKGRSALFSLLGHKGDLMLIHFRRTFDELNREELVLSNLRLADFLEPTTSYLSVVELGLYEVSVRLYSTLSERGIQPGTPEWNRAVDRELVDQHRAAEPRLWPIVPSRRYVCFYPMNKLRGEEKNWYQVSTEERQRMMREHGMIGRRYAGHVTQIISASIGFDDWEWGVDLFADDPLVFKKLVYEMRFDEASAVYGLFGTFYVGLQFPAGELGKFLEGKLPPANGRSAGGP
jgi:chlorite dismutase